MSSSLAVIYFISISPFARGESLGYNNPFLLKAVSKQLSTMPHVMFGGLIHKQAVDLSKKITLLMGNNLEKVFFVDSGSVSVEVAPFHLDFLILVLVNDL